MTPGQDARHMALALSLGRRGLGRVWPNPAVGCVIVQDGRIVGRARTGDGGRPHAETQALAQAGAAAAGATVYVTLEPCAHHGQTPPCADALIAAGVGRVVVATGDPDPRVAGQGIARLRAAGITVDLGVAADVARADHAGFLSVRERGRPFLTLKLGQSLDGRIATARGDSQWITGPTARHIVHGMRLSHDAVMVGAGTLRADDPGLDVRGFGALPQPVRVVVSRDLYLPASARMFATAADQPVWLLHAGKGVPEALNQPGVTSVPVAAGAGPGVDMAAGLSALAARGLTRVFCEGGGQLAASLLRAGLVDRLVTFTGGVAIGADGLPGLGALGVSDLADAPRFALQSTRALAGDVMQVWHPT